MCRFYPPYAYVFQPARFVLRSVLKSLQSYSVNGWDYITELHEFVDNGLSGNAFIDAVSGIVNRGCHDPPCATGDVDGKAGRSSNFFKVLTEFGII